MTERLMTDPFMFASLCQPVYQEAKYSVTKPPKAWMSWEECQQSRLRCEQAYERIKDGENVREKLATARACALLVLLTALPPDRVAVYRRLKIGDSLKAAVGGSDSAPRYQVDLSERGAHSECCRCAYLQP
jgi:hypothetical protein